MPTRREIPYDPQILAQILPAPPGFSEGYERVVEAVESLPEPQRDVLELYFWGRFSLREIGEQLGLARSSVFDIKAKALVALQEVLSADRD